MRRCLVGVTASAGWPKASDERVFTSQITSGAAARADQVELAVAAPPVAGHHLVAVRDVPGGRPVLPCRPQPQPGRGHRSRSGLASSSMFTSLNVTTRTDGTKRILVWRYMSHTQASVMQQLDAGAAAVGVDGVLHGVGQVEAALGLHHVPERGRDVAVLLEELVLDLRLVLLQVVGAHRRAPARGPRGGELLAWDHEGIVRPGCDNRGRRAGGSGRPGTTQKSRFSLTLAALPTRSRR